MTILEKIKEFSKTFMYEEFNTNSNSFLQIKKYFIASIKDINKKKYSEKEFEIILFISHTIGNKPFITQEEIYNLIYIFPKHVLSIFC